MLKKRRTCKSTGLISAILFLSVMLTALPVWNVAVKAEPIFPEMNLDFSENPSFEASSVGSGTLGCVEDNSMPGAADDNKVYKMSVSAAGGPWVIVYMEDSDTSTYLYGPFTFEYDFKASTDVRYRIQVGPSGTDNHLFEFWKGTMNKFSTASDYASMTPFTDVTGANMTYNSDDWFHLKLCIDYGKQVSSGLTGIEKPAYLSIELTNKTTGKTQLHEETYSTNAAESPILRYLQWYKNGFVDRFRINTVSTGTAGDILIDNYRQTVLDKVSYADISAATGNDKNGSFNRFSDRVHKFDLEYANMPVSGNAKYNTWVLDRYIYTGRSVVNTAAANHVKISEPESGVKALDMTYSMGATADAPVNDSNFVVPMYFDKQNPVTNLDLAFRIKRTAINWSDFILETRGVDEARRTPVFFGKDGYVYLVGNKVATYEADKWYNVKLKVDYTTKYARLGLKGENDTDYTYYDMTYSAMPSLASTGGSAAIPSVAWVQFMSFCSEETPTAEYHTYITDYMQNTSSTGFKPTMNSQNDNFEGALADTVFAPAGSSIVGLTTATDDYVASNIGWIASANDTNNSVSIATIDGNKVLKMNKTAFSNTEIFTLTKTNYSGNTDANAIHRIRFKMGGGGFAGLQVVLNGNIVPFNVYNSKVSYHIGSWSPAFAVTSDTALYDFEVVYNSATGDADYCVVSPEGKQYVGQRNLEAKPLTSIAFRIAGTKAQNEASAATETNLYLDDFRWDILSGSASGTASTDGAADDASLDEWVYIDYGETVDGPALADDDTAPTVTVTCDGSPVITPYTLAADGEKLIVKFSDLDIGKEYNVSVSNVPMLCTATATDGDGMIFTTLTADKAISATKPVLSGGTVSSTVKSCYAHGRKVNLIVSLYKDDAISDVKIVPINADSRAGRSVTLNLDGADYDKAYAYVWSEFLSMVPYAESADY